MMLFFQALVADGIPHAPPTGRFRGKLVPHRCCSVGTAAGALVMLQRRDANAQICKYDMEQFKS